MPELARLFVAVTLPAAIRSELARWSRVAVAGAEPVRGGVRRMAPEMLHLTLCFLGEQSLASVAVIADVLAAAAEPLAAVGELAVGAPVWLPPRRPRALAVEIGDRGGGLGRLQTMLVGEITEAIGWRPGRERFRPHVTVARMRSERAPGGVLPPTPQLRFDCERVALLRSHLEPAGAWYEELTSVGGWGG